MLGVLEKSWTFASEKGYESCLEGFTEFLI